MDRPLAKQEDMYRADRREAVDERAPKEPRHRHESLEEAIDQKGRIGPDRGIGDHEIDVHEHDPALDRVLRHDVGKGALPRHHPAQDPDREGRRKGDIADADREMSHQDLAVAKEGVAHQNVAAPAEPNPALQDVPHDPPGLLPNRALERFREIRLHGDDAVEIPAIAADPTPAYRVDDEDLRDILARDAHGEFVVFGQRALVEGAPAIRFRREDERTAAEARSDPGGRHRPCKPLAERKGARVCKDANSSM